LFCDASDKYWGSTLTQVPVDQLDLPVEQQTHEPIAFLSGAFTKASRNWSIVEKEAWAIIDACKRLDHFLLVEGGI
jgi:hypothetical protein